MAEEPTNASRENGLFVLRSDLSSALAIGDENAGVSVARRALESGVTPLEFALEVIQPELQGVGERFSRLEIFLPELMAAATVVEAVQSQVLNPAIRAHAGDEVLSRGKVVIGTIQGDIHDIGKNMVALLLQVNGFDVVDLGTDVAPQRFVDAAQQAQADIIAMSSLITPSMPFMGDTISLLAGYDLRDHFKVDEIGADGYGEDAVQAVAVCCHLVGRTAQ